MDILTIGGVTLPAPNEYKVQLNDLDSSDTGRTEDGVMMRNRVREGIAKISAAGRRSPPRIVRGSYMR